MPSTPSRISEPYFARTPATTSNTPSTSAYAPQRRTSAAIVIPGRANASSPKAIATRPRRSRTHQCCARVRIIGSLLSRTWLRSGDGASDARRSLLLLGGPAPLGLALVGEVGAMRALVGLDVLEASLRVPNGVELLARDAAMGRALGHGLLLAAESMQFR